MRFLLPVIAFFFFGFLSYCSADLRYASSPKESRFAVRNRDGSVNFATTIALYMEPSTFGYAGLNNQRQNNYDNFLRSNIDNEQDLRNFNTEAGKDHLPFRTLEARVDDATKQIPESMLFTAEPGKEYVLPLRMNHPHAYEIELNIWIRNNEIVIPIKKPVCAGEGYQDAVISFIVPTDFNDLISKVPNFNGCQKPGDCTLQLYAHSVEPRTYAVGTPIIVTGFDPSKPKATDEKAIQAATKDPGTDFSQLTSDVCLSSTNPASHYPNAIPRYARHVSDVYNHAYQNSDYSHYSGQQHEAISKNLQAACILRMVNGDRGELGKSILTIYQKHALSTLRNTTDTIVKNYETITNKIINQVLKNGAKSTGTVAANTAGAQKLNNCFRCAPTASVSSNRLERNSFIPSFKIENAAQLLQARTIINSINDKYANLINANGVLQIYWTAFIDMAPFYKELGQKYGLGYQTAQIKTGPQTMSDKTGFRKININGQQDRGVYAATQAKVARDAAGENSMTVSYDYIIGNYTSILTAGFTLDALEASMVKIDLINSTDTPALLPNVDDDPAYQNSYEDREDIVESLSLRSGGSDADINAITTTTTTTAPATTTTTTPTTVAAGASMSSSSSTSVSNGAAAGIGVGGLLIGIGLTMFFQRYKANMRMHVTQKVSNNINAENNNNNNNNNAGAEMTSTAV